MLSPICICKSNYRYRMLLSGSPFPAKATYKPTVVVTGVCLSAGDTHTCWLTAAKPYDGASFPTHPDKRYLPQYPHPANPPPLAINIQTPPGSALAAPYVKSCYVLTRSNTCYLILWWIPALQWYLFCGRPSPPLNGWPDSERSIRGMTMLVTGLVRK